MRVAIYARVSSAEQTKGHSLDSQRDTLSIWAEREGWEIAGVYEDPGISAWKAADKRPGFMRMVEDAEARQFDAVLVSSRNRYARNVGEAVVVDVEQDLIVRFTPKRELAPLFVTGDPDRIRVVNLQTGGGRA